ncbi:ABC transporter G family member 31, partial [Globisporangium polare]
MAQKAQTHGSMPKPVDTIKNIKFDGQRFPPYKASLKAALRARNLWDLLVGDEVEPIDQRNDASKKARRYWRQRLLNLDDILTNTLNDEYKEKLDEYDSPVEKWAALVREFEVKPFTNAHFLKKTLYTSEFDSKNESVRAYWDRMMAIRRQLTGMNVRVSDDDMISAILTGLGKEHEALIDTYSTTEGLTLQQL